MHLSTHYYVLSLSSTKNNLFEAFRDSLITIENQGFPVVAPAAAADSPHNDRLRDLALAVDKRLAHYYTLDPLGLVVVGNGEMQAAFDSVTVHGAAVIGRVDGDHTATSAHALGQMTWPVVKEAMSGVLDTAMRDLDASAGRGWIASGLEAVARAVNGGARATLLVEDGYHMRGSLSEASGSPAISSEVDVREVVDDAVDAVIERVLQSGGNVVFTPGGSLSDHNRIVLLMHGADSK